MAGVLKPEAAFGPLPQRPSHGYLRSRRRACRPLISSGAGMRVPCWAGVHVAALASGLQAAPHRSYFDRDSPYNPPI